MQYPAKLVGRVSALYARGMSQIEVATAIRSTQKVVWNLMRRHRLKSRPRVKRNQFGANNGSWKGDRAGKQAFHRRLYAQFGKPRKCTRCQTTDPAKSYDYANLTGNYKDSKDYAAMCRSCHWKFDKKHLNFRGAGGGKCPRG